MRRSPARPRDVSRGPARAVDDHCLLSCRQDSRGISVLRSVSVKSELTSPIAEPANLNHYFAWIDSMYLARPAICARARRSIAAEGSFASIALR